MFDIRASASGLRRPFIDSGSKLASAFLGLPFVIEGFVRYANAYQVTCKVKNIIQYSTRYSCEIEDLVKLISASVNLYYSRIQGSPPGST